MSQSPVKIETVARLNRNLGLLQAGSMVTIDFATPAGQKGKFRTTFVGYLPKKYVLVQYPDTNKLGNFGKYITQGIGVTVRGLIEGQEGAVAAFVSNVKQTIQIPSKLIVLDFPRTVTIQSLRNSLRIDTDIQAKVKIGKEYWSSMITDISINGCQLNISNGEQLTLMKDKVVEITVEEFQGLSNLKLSAEICSAKAQFDGICLGLKFQENSRPNVTKLLHHIITVEL